MVTNAPRDCQGGLQWLGLHLALSSLSG
jgi:hypothetical protein